MSKLYVQYKGQEPAEFTSPLGTSGKLLLSDLTITAVPVTTATVIYPQRTDNVVDVPSGYDGFNQVTVKAISEQAVNNEALTITPTLEGYSVNATTDPSTYSGYLPITVNPIDVSVFTPITVNNPTLTLSDISISGSTEEGTIADLSNVDSNSDFIVISTSASATYQLAEGYNTDENQKSSSDAKEIRIPVFQLPTL